MSRFSLSLLLTLVACSSDPPAPTTVDAPGTPVDARPPVDAPVAIDAPPIDARPIDAPPAAATVMEVACPSSTVPVVMATSGMFLPEATSIAVDGIVKFTMPDNHSVVPSPDLPTDTGLNVGFRKTKCLKFTKAGTFNFECNPHGFPGSITVQ